MCVCVYNVSARSCRYLVTLQNTALLITRNVNEFSIIHLRTIRERKSQFSKLSTIVPSMRKSRVLVYIWSQIWLYASGFSGFSNVAVLPIKEKTQQWMPVTKGESPQNYIITCPLLGERNGILSDMKLERNPESVQIEKMINLWWCVLPDELNPNERAFVTQRNKFQG